ncbi:hypothetical protein ACLMJK_005677 [Lecanora helva]
MDGLSAAASIIAVIQMTGTVIGCLDNVINAEKERKRLQDELWGIYGILIFVKEVSNSGQDGSWNTTLRSLQAPNGPIQTLNSALQSLSERLATTNGAKKIGQRLKWPFKEKETKELFATIERQKGILILARQNDHILLTKATHTMVEETRKGVDDIRQGMDKFQLIAKDQSHHDILRWLSAPDPSMNYQNALRLRHPKTGSWLLGSSTYLDWKATSGSLLWLYGIPGCGKTVLSATALEDLLELSGQSPKTKVVYFYFDFNDSEKQRHEKMIRSLAWQLCSGSEEAPESFITLYKTCDNGNSQPNHQNLLKSLRQAMVNIDTVYIVLDALDECNERTHLLEDIRDVFSWDDVRLHLLATSRRETDIVDSIGSLCKNGGSICIQSSVVDKDIREYVRDQLRTNLRLRKWQNKPEIQREIEETLMERAGGMFRWASCQIDSIAKCINIRQLRQVLTSLPKDLDATYERIICNIEEIHQPLALKLLQWLAYSTRPLTFDQVAEVATIDVHDDQRVDPEKRLEDPQDLLMICSSLVSCDFQYPSFDQRLSRSSSSLSVSAPGDNSSLTGSRSISISTNGYLFSDHTQGQSPLVRLAHFSVKEFLISDRIRRTKASNFSLLEADANAVIAADCLVYLFQWGRGDEDEASEYGQCDLDDDVEEDEDEDGQYESDDDESQDDRLYWTPTGEGMSALAEHAVNAWPTYARIAEATVVDWISPLIVELLLGDEPQVSKWKLLFGTDLYHIYELSVWYPDYSYSKIREVLSRPLHCASALDLPKLAIYLIDKGYDSHDTIDLDEEPSPLAVACNRFNGRIVDILLRSSDGSSDCQYALDVPLAIACERGDKELMNSLLARGADPNAQNALKGNSLRAACVSNNNSLVEELIKKGADVNARGSKPGSALQDAIMHQDIQIVKLLLHHGADTNAVGAPYGTALQAALRSRREGRDKVQILLEHGADVNVQVGKYGTALQSASRQPDSELVKLLLQQGADVNAMGGEYSTALIAASVVGLYENVQLLLDHGADVNACGGLFHRCYHTALQSASLEGHERIVQLLLDYGADVNAYGGSSGTAMEASVLQSNTKVTDILLAHGAKRLDELERDLQGAGYGELVAKERALRATQSDESERSDSMY